MSKTPFRLTKVNELNFRYHEIRLMSTGALIGFGISRSFRLQGYLTDGPLRFQCDISAPMTPRTNRRKLGSIPD